jgi:antitoxin component YwqK of YwqJK toxin-antitoxin module
MNSSSFPLLLFALFTAPAFAQVREYFVTDTASVLVYFDKAQVIPDTVYRLKKDLIPGTDHVIWYDTERKQKCVEFIRGEAGGFTTWYRNGQVNTIMKPVIRDSASYIAWHSDGKPKIRTTASGDSVIVDYYYSNGQLAYKEVTFRSKFIYYEKWCENGQLVTKIHFTLARRTLVTHYYCNGKKKVEYFAGNGTATGKWVEWYENGNIKTEGYYPDYADEEVAKGPLPFPLETGTWKYYDERGRLEKEIIYNKGKVLKEIFH